MAYERCNVVPQWLDAFNVSRAFGRMFHSCMPSNPNVNIYCGTFHACMKPHGGCANATKYESTFNQFDQQYTQSGSRLCGHFSNEHLSFVQFLKMYNKCLSFVCCATPAQMTMMHNSADLMQIN